MKSEEKTLKIAEADAQYVQLQIDAGRFRNREEVAREAMWLLRENEAKRLKVQGEIAGLCADMDAGKGIVTTKEEFSSLVGEALKRVLE